MSNIPKIRFKGFTEDWEQRKFSDIAARESSIYTSSSDIPSVEYEDVVAEEGRLNKDVRSKEAVKSGIIFDGSQVLYGKLRPYLHNWLNPDFKGIAVGDWWVLKPINTDKNFLYRLIQTQQFDNIANQSSGSKMPRADWNLISDSEFMISLSKEEQSKIGDYFNSLDHLITLHQRKYDETTELKKYMLKKMFPEKNKNVPEIRFPEFTEEWETCTFGELADYKKGPFGSALKKDIFIPKSDNAVKVYEQQNAINKDWHLERYFITKEYAEKMSGFKVQGGDIIVSCAGTIGETYEIPMDADSGIINQALMKISVNEKMVDKKMFIILFTNMIDDFTRVHSNGSAIKNIPPFSDLKPMKVFVPGMEEQMKISSYFSNLDHLLTLHQQKIDELTELKKYMLQNMFPKKEG